MSASAKSVWYFGLYLIGVSLFLVLVPNFLLSLFQLPATEEVWIRIVGFLAGCLAVYYLVAARNELKPIFVASVYLRASVVLVFGAFVALKMVGPPLLLFAVVDLLAAAWTYRALRQEAAKN